MKKLVISIIVVTICISLCACGETKQNPKSEDKLVAIQMLIDADEVTLYLLDSNRAVLDFIYAMKSTNADEDTCLVYFKKALELVKDAKTRVDNSLPFPNTISKEFEELEENYEETYQILSSSYVLSEEELDRVLSLMDDGADKHILLVKTMIAFSSLCQIRYFYQFSDDENQGSLEDNWWKFGFNDDIQCPETIEEQELYLMWGRQFFAEFDEDKFLEELENLRKNDDLSSPECNQKWIELIGNFIS